MAQKLKCATWYSVLFSRCTFCSLFITTCVIWCVYDLATRKPVRCQYFTFHPSNHKTITYAFWCWCINCQFTRSDRVNSPCCWLTEEWDDMGIILSSSSSSSGPGAYAADAPQPIRLIVQPWTPLYGFDVPTSAARRLHVHTTREILAAKGGTVGENVAR
jgi:hypothetical protein